MDKFLQIFTCNYDTKVGNNETFLPTFLLAIKFNFVVVVQFFTLFFGFFSNNALLNLTTSG